MSAAVQRPARDRPPLVFVAAHIARHAPSEAGKSWNWARALARHYQLHLVAPTDAAQQCRDEPEAAGWSWHVTPRGQPLALGLRYYGEYAQWCRDATEVIRELIPAVRPVLVHHITLGSFRVLPRYDRCGAPYTIGPLGGGETTPRELLRTARFPTSVLLAEFFRPWLNRAATMVPSLRAVMRATQLALATTPETETVLRRMGARRTGVAFPDCLAPDVDPTTARPAAERAAELPRRVRLIWAGRAVWWKAGQLALELLARLRGVGIDAELAMYCGGPAADAWRNRAAALGLGDACRVHGLIPRPQLLAELGRAHVFVFPTLHDSANAALLEAYAMGLPSLTVGLGGPAVIATPETGFNVRPDNLDTWVGAAAARVRHWQQEPAGWLAASEAAVRRARAFGPAHIEAIVDRWLMPEVRA